MIELDETVRQREDGQFAELLSRTRTAMYTEEDIETLKLRVVQLNTSR